MMTKMLSYNDDKDVIYLILQNRLNLYLMSSLSYNDDEDVKLVLELRTITHSI